MMRGEIIAIGDELTSGRILNSTSRFAASRLFAAGYQVPVFITIGDDQELIAATLLAALERADFVIVTGGLGTTSDDLTNEAVSAALERPATLYPEVLRKIKANSHHLSERARKSLEKLAWLPDGAHALHSEAKSAGYFLVHQGKPVFFLPGVPHEMQELLEKAVLPRLEVWDGRPRRRVRQRVFRLAGVTESEVNHRLADLEAGDGTVKIGYYPVFPEVQVSLTVVGEDEGAVERRFQAVEAEIRRRLGTELFGVDDETLAAAVVNLCRQRGLWLAVAESCSGGLLAAAITGVAGASQCFAGGAVTYSNELKERLLGVAGATLAARGAVSAEVAREMAAGLRRLTGAELILATTGIAGPAGGSEDKPVGTVFIALTVNGETTVEPCNFVGTRRQIQVLTVQRALNMLRHRLLAI